MKIDFTAPILDSKGQPIPIADAKGEPTEEITTLRTLAEQALLSQFPDEKDLATLEKVKRYKLFNKLNGATTDLTAEEIVLLKLVIGKAFTPLAVGRAFDIIEPPDELE